VVDMRKLATAKMIEKEQGESPHNH
jgi:hypothetical protein